jgi:hypothetical protein
VSARHVDVVIILSEGGLICESGKKVFFFSATNSNLINFRMYILTTNVLHLLIGSTSIISSTKVITINLKLDR